MDMNYRETLITVAEDCPVTSSVVPVLRAGKRTLPVLQYELLKAHPYRYTSAEVLFESHMRHKGVPDSELKGRRQELWEAFFATPQACLRASALPKKYGFGIHCDEDGRVALCPMESAEYARRVSERSTKVVKALRSSRRA